MEVEWSVKTFQHDFNDAILVALQPFAVGESGVDVVNAASVRLVAGDAVRFAVEHFFSEVVGLAISSRELLVGWAVGLVGGGAEPGGEESVTGDGIFSFRERDELFHRLAEAVVDVVVLLGHDRFCEFDGLLDVRSLDEAEGAHGFEAHARCGVFDGGFEDANRVW